MKIKYKTGDDVVFNFIDEGYISGTIEAISQNGNNYLYKVASYRFHNPQWIRERDIFGLEVK